jgi:hypothetical protein
MSLIKVQHRGKRKAEEILEVKEGGPQSGDFALMALVPILHQKKKIIQKVPKTKEYLAAFPHVYLSPFKR